MNANVALCLEDVQASKAGATHWAGVNANQVIWPHTPKKLQSEPRGETVLVNDVSVWIVLSISMKCIEVLTV